MRLQEKRFQVFFLVIVRSWCYKRRDYSAAVVNLWHVCHSRLFIIESSKKLAITALVILKFQQYHSHGGLKTQVVWPNLSFKMFLRWGPKVQIPNNFSGNTDAADPETTQWEPLYSLNAVRVTGKDI